jgi:hypothetical protein
MSSQPHPSSSHFNYKGVEIRRRPEDGFVCISDLWKAEGRPWSCRPDLWAKEEENQCFLEATTLRLGTSGWLAIRGGSASLQGTFAVPDVAVRYASYLSLECSDWLCGVLNSTVGLNRARRRTVYLGVIPLEVFQLVSGEYKLSQTQVADAIGKDESSFRQFLASKQPEALPYKGFKSGSLPVEDSKKPINPVPIDLAIAYWTKEARADNQIAIGLLSACARETIERRADVAFGVGRSESEYNHRFKTAFEKFVDLFPEYAQTRSHTTPPVESMVLAEQASLKRFKKKLPAEIFNLSKGDFINEIVYLGAAADWHLTPEKGLAYPAGAVHRNAYPDLISLPAECQVDGKPARVILLLQYVDSIVDENHIKDCVYFREYIDLVKQHYQVDHALLFFVSPYGVTRYAAACIKERDELRGCVGVITVRQLAKFLYEKASANKDNIRSGRLKNRYQCLMNYKMLEELVNQEELNRCPIQAKSMPELQLDLFAS